MTILEALDDLLELGVEYVYFIDEIFLPDPNLRCALAERSFKFGIQTRVDLWKPAMLDRDIPTLREIWDRAPWFVGPDDRDALRSALNRLIGEPVTRVDCSTPQPNGEISGTYRISPGAPSFLGR